MQQLVNLQARFQRIQLGQDGEDAAGDQLWNDCLEAQRHLTADTLALEPFLCFLARVEWFRLGLDRPVPDASPLMRAELEVDAAHERVLNVHRFLDETLPTYSEFLEGRPTIVQWTMTRQAIEREAEAVLKRLYVPLDRAANFVMARALEGMTRGGLGADAASGERTLRDAAQRVLDDLAQQRGTDPSLDEAATLLDELKTLLYGI